MILFNKRFVKSVTTSEVTYPLGSRIKMFFANKTQKVFTNSQGAQAMSDLEILSSENIKRGSFVGDDKITYRIETIRDSSIGMKQYLCVEV